MKSRGPKAPSAPLQLLEGSTVCPGVAMGPVHLQGYELESLKVFRIAADRVEEELNRFREGIRASQHQVKELRDKLKETVGLQEARILDAHLAYLRDPVLVADVETLVINERLNLEGAISKVIADFDRVFQLVENEQIKERAADLRDVATRVLRNLPPSSEAPPGVGPPPPGKYILAARQLTIADMFNLENERVEGIIAEEGGLSSHAAILARSMRIPTITGIPDLPSKLREGEFVLLDAGSGLVRIAPDERVVREYSGGVPAVEARGEEEVPARLLDGTEIRLLASCGNLSEVSQALETGMDGVGLFRTELLFVVETKGPGEEALVKQYAEVVRRAGEMPVCFRLLDAGSDVPVAGQPAVEERNPALGLRAVRALLRDQRILRLQLRAILRAGAGGRASLAVPFVTSGSDLVRVRRALLEERQALLKEGKPCADQVSVGPVVEVPAAAMSLASLLHESDFVVVAWDNLLQYVLAADRDNAAVRDYYEAFHPAVFDLLARMAADAEREDKDLVLFGEGASDALRLPFFIGAGLRRLSVAPGRATAVRRVLARWTLPECEALAERVLEAGTSLDVQRLLLEAEK